MGEVFTLADRESRDDLRTTLERIARAGREEVRLVARGDVLAVFGCTQAPEHLLDRLPVVLVMRSFRLADRLDLDEVVHARALLDRLARGEERSISMPDATVTASWAGVMPPIGGWEAVGAVEVESLRAVARDGAERIAEALPTDPGEPMVNAVRRAVWGAEILPGVPAAAAFAAELLGFLGSGERAMLSHSRTWYRLDLERGSVFVRSGVG